MKNRLVILLITVAVVTGLVIAGCAAPAPAPTPAPTPAPAPAPEEEVISVLIATGGSGASVGWNGSYYEGYLYVEEKYPDVDMSFSDLVPYADTVTYLDMVAKTGVDMILTDLHYFEAATKVASKYPDTWFVVQNMMPEMLEEMPSNLTSYSWRDEQSGYLAGVLAGMMTESNTLGFVGGLDYPDLVRLGSGYALGAQSVNPDAKTEAVWLGSWEDPEKAYNATIGLIDLGADVFIHLTDAGGSGLIDAVKERGVWVIGEARDQSYLAPEVMLTSYRIFQGALMDAAISDLLAGKMVQEVKWSGAQEGEEMLWPLSEHVPADVKAKVDEVYQQIASGALEVPMIFGVEEFDAIRK